VLDRWCQAQPLADVATDQELFAAYCLGAIIASQGDGSLSEIETLLDTPRCSAKIAICVEKYASTRPYVQKNVDDCRDE